MRICLFITFFPWSIIITVDSVAYTELFEAGYDIVSMNSRRLCFMVSRQPKSQESQRRHTISVSWVSGDPTASLYEVLRLQVLARGSPGSAWLFLFTSIIRNFSRFPSSLGVRPNTPVSVGEEGARRRPPAAARSSPGRRWGGRTGGGEEDRLASDDVSGSSSCGISSFQCTMTSAWLGETGEGGPRGSRHTPALSSLSRRNLTPTLPSLSRLALEPTLPSLFRLVLELTLPSLLRLALEPAFPSLPRLVLELMAPSLCRLILLAALSKLSSLTLSLPLPRCGAPPLSLLPEGVSLGSSMVTAT